jgi:G:T/U-mismatch repair DNA glycosylase
MPIILHKFKDHQVNAQTEVLFLGTFNPDIPNGADFFYGRSRSFLWHLLPQCWDLPPLKEASLVEKQEFMATYKIDFADLITALDVPLGEEENVDDDFIDSHVQQWKDIIALIDTLPELKEVYFTRKTFNGIPNMRTQVRMIASYCFKKGIRFCKLETPARFYNPEKQQQWIDTIVLKTSCLRP